MISPITVNYSPLWIPIILNCVIVAILLARQAWDEHDQMGFNFDQRLSYAIFFTLVLWLVFFAVMYFIK